MQQWPCVFCDDMWLEYFGEDQPPGLRLAFPAMEPGVAQPVLGKKCLGPELPCLIAWLGSDDGQIAGALRLSYLGFVKMRSIYTATGLCPGPISDLDGWLQVRLLWLPLRGGIVSFPSAAP